jgi:PAS domain S-box-containing protein
MPGSLAPRQEVVSDLTDRLVRVAQLTPHAVMLSDPAGRIQWINAAFTEITGYSLEEARGRRPAELLQSVETDPAAQTAMRKAMAKGEPYRIEVAYRAKDGRRIWLDADVRPTYGPDGKAEGFMAVQVDTTSAREAEARLRASERFARGVINGVGAMLTVIDETGLIIAANKAFQALGREILDTTAYPMGRNLFEAVMRLPAPHGAALRKGLKAVLAGESDAFVRAYLTESGEWFRMTAKRFDGEGPARCVVITQSIEELKRSERRLRRLNASLKKARDEADAANAAKSEFLVTMSHEIRTPLNGVIGMAQVMARDELSDRQVERLSVIRQSGETLLSLLNDLLDLSKIEAGKLELEDGEVDIVPLIRTAGATFAPAASDKGVTLSVEVAPEAQGLWRGDPVRVRQIVYNLISNAVKFTARGSVSVTVRHEDGRLVFAVSDTGAGIPPDRLGALFQRFVQQDATTARRFGGSGLGLSICRELATRMGGEIAATSEIGKGSTFTASLPLARIAAADASVAVPAEEAVIGHDLRILAAEDNPMNQLVLKTLLGQIGIEVTCVSDGAEAVKAAQSGGWDVILMDVMMPGMDGPTAARAIRTREAARGLPRVPIIALTANAMAHHATEYRAAGMDDLVPKPLEMERLLEALQSVLAPSVSVVSA